MVHSPTSDQATNDQATILEVCRGYADVSTSVAVLSKGKIKDLAFSGPTLGSASVLVDEEALLADRPSWLHGVPLSDTSDRSRRLDKVFRTETHPAGFCEQLSKEGKRLAARAARTERNVSLCLFFLTESGSPAVRIVWMCARFTTRERDWGSHQRNVDPHFRLSERHATSGSRIGWNGRQARLLA